MYTAYKILAIISVINILAILVEWAYSYYKKDNVYSHKVTMNNLVSIFISKVIGFETYPFFISIFFYFYFKSFFIKLPPFDVKSFFFCLILTDLVYYIFHIVHHKNKYMWSLHVVHHSDHKLNLSTASRASWVELLYLPLFYLPLVFLGFHPYMIFLCYYIVFNHAFWVHSQYIKLPFFLDYLIFIPQNHQVHHDREIQNQNSNFGGLFTIWDRLLGTFKRSVDNFTAGLKDYKEENFLKFQVHTTLKLLKKL